MKVYFLVIALTTEGLNCEQHVQAHTESESGNPVYDWIKKLERRQDCFEAAQQVTIDRINFMQTDLRSSRKAMHELLAIVKQTAAERRVSYAREIGLISELPTGEKKCTGETTVPVDLAKSPRQGMLHVECLLYPLLEA